MSEPLNYRTPTRSRGRLWILALILWALVLAVLAAYVWTEIVPLFRS